MISAPLPTYILLFLLMLIPNDLFSQSYLWPTNSSEYLSASFCEFREGHYHSAIDIKTWNTEGYPCYAVTDGYIKRIRVSPFGYGKVLYLQLSDGQTAVYAHLQKFTKSVEEKIREMQFKNKRYRLDWWPKNLKVKKGDIIAYTGRTGIGVPHLHFEIRNKKDNPVNPLQYYPQVKDHIRPKLQAIAVIPLSEKATINGSYLPQTFSVKHIKEGIYVINEPLYVKGLVGLAIKGYDQADDVHNKYGFYQTTLEVSGQEIFQITYDELDFQTTAHIYTEIFYPFWSDHKERYQKLYIESFNPLPFYNRSLSADGMIDTIDEPTSFKIYVSDFKNNRSIVSGELLPAEQFDLKINEKTLIGTQAYLRIAAPPISDMKFYIEKDNTWSPVQTFEILDGKISQPEQGMLVKIDLADSTVRRIRIKLNKYINKYITFSPVEEKLEINPRLYFLGKKIIAEYQEPHKITVPKLSGLNTSIAWDQSNGSKLQIILPLNPPGTQSMARGVFSDSLINYLNKSVRMLLPMEKSCVSWFDSTVVIKSFNKSVNDTTLITAHCYQSDSLLETFPTVSRIYEISPDNFPLFKSVLIKLRADSLPEWGNWSIFKINGQNKLTFLKSEIDADNLEFKAKTSALGKFVIAADTIAPVIEIKSPQNGEIYSSTPPIRIHLKDQISGIGDEEDISLSVNGNYVLQEWDPEEDELIGILENDLLKGNHVFSVSVRDRAGNISRQAVYFSIE